MDLTKRSFYDQRNVFNAYTMHEHVLYLIYSLFNLPLLSAFRIQLQRTVPQVICQVWILEVLGPFKLISTGCLVIFVVLTEPPLPKPQCEETCVILD